MSEDFPGQLFGGHMHNLILEDEAKKSGYTIKADKDGSFDVVYQERIFRLNFQGLPRLAQFRRFFRVIRRPAYPRQILRHALEPKLCLAIRADNSNKCSFCRHFHESSISQII